MLNFNFYFLLAQQCFALILCTNEEDKNTAHIGGDFLHGL